MHTRYRVLSSLLCLLLSGCIALPWSQPTPTETPSPIATIPQPTPAARDVAVNPLSGLVVADPGLLKVPAVLISISHFPATARPQAALSFAPFVYEFYITEGATRFLAVFHGEWPAPEIPVRGGCAPRYGPFLHTATLLGNRVWLDGNANGVQDAGEGGIVGLCVNLLDSGGAVIGETTSDTNGYYGFDVKPGRYTVQFVRPGNLDFTQAGAGSDAEDSDADPASGLAPIDLVTDNLTVDAGFTLRATEGTSDVAGPLPLAQVGPIRSGRLLYRHLAQAFQDSCLIYASASPEVLARLPKCAVVFHQIQGGGFMLDLEQLWSVAKNNQRKHRSELDYGVYDFHMAPPTGMSPAQELRVYISYQNQSGWYYDPISESYLRYVDTSVRDEAGILHPETDRLNGRQLSVQNIIVMFAKHEVVSPTNLDIRLDPGKSGKAVLFRDGQSLNIDWVNPRGGDGAGRPIEFLQKDGRPAPLKPGHTWVLIVTPESSLKAASAGRWRLTFVAPEGAK